METHRLLLAISFFLVSDVAAEGSRPQLSCQFISGVVNCSAGRDFNDGAYFIQDRDEELQVRVSLTIPPGQSDFSVASVDGLVQRFLPAEDLSVELTPGPGQCRLLPGCLDSLTGISRLTLRLRLAGGRIPEGVFSARLARLRNLQLEAPQVLEVAYGAFSDLRSLERLSLANLQLDRLDRSLLRGLSSLRILELQDNRFARLDGASFAASPRLETINLRSRWAGQLVVAADTFCSLHSLLQLEISNAVGLNCSSFSSRQMHLIVGGSEELSFRCLRQLGQSTACTGTAGVRWTSPTLKKTTAAATPLVSSLITKQTELASTTVLKNSSPEQPATKGTIACRARTTVTGAATSSTPFSKTISRSDRQPTPLASASSGVSAGPIIAGVIVAAILLLAAVSAGILVTTRRRSGGVIRGRSLRRSRSQQPIFSPSGVGDAEIDMQDAVWNPAYQEGDSSTVAAIENGED